MEHLFEYDHLINEGDFCNFSTEKMILKKHVEAGDCVKLFAPRNFGKTSLIKNIIAKNWEGENESKRMVIYADFYSVESLDSISLELTKAFSQAISRKKNFFDKGLDWFKSLKHIRPTWQPPTSSDSFGEFSIRTENNGAVVNFEIIFENIYNLHKNNKMEFLIVMDEFQEVGKIPQACAKLRGALQNFDTQIPIVFLGSKQHLLQEIFNRPKAPFYSWGYSVELHPIPYEEYHSYITTRLARVKKSIELEEAKFLQDKMHRIPEAINRLCDFLARDSDITKITKDDVKKGLLTFVDRSRSIYEEVFASFNHNERHVLLAMAKLGTVENITGKTFLIEVPMISKTTVSDITKRFLNDSVITKTIDEKKKVSLSYQITDPFLEAFLLQYKVA